MSYGILVMALYAYGPRPIPEQRISYGELVMALHSYGPRPIPEQRISYGILVTALYSYVPQANPGSAHGLTHMLYRCNGTEIVPPVVHLYTIFLVLLIIACFICVRPIAHLLTQNLRTPLLDAQLCWRQWRRPRSHICTRLQLNIGVSRRPLKHSSAEPRGRANRRWCSGG